MSTFKVVHLNTSLLGGAGRAVNRLHIALLKNDVQSSLLNFDSFLDFNQKIYKNYDVNGTKIINKNLIKIGIKEVDVIFGSGFLLKKKSHFFHLFH